MKQEFISIEYLKFIDRDDDDDDYDYDYEMQHKQANIKEEEEEDEVKVKVKVKVIVRNENINPSMFNLSAFNTLSILDCIFHIEVVRGHVEREGDISSIILSIINDSIFCC